MPDIQIHAGGTETVPYDYVLTSDVDVAPKAILATFDGTGAAGAFLPTLVILAPGGAEVARIPTSSTVAAGASSQVTFAPFLESEPASSTPTTATADWAMATNPALTIVQGSTTNTWPYTTFATGNSSMFTLDGGIGTVNTNREGLYEMQAYVLVFSGNAVTAHLSLDQPLPTTAGDSTLSLGPGISTNRPGTATAIGGVFQWELFYRTFYNIKSSLNKFGFRVIAEAAGGDWTFAQCLLTVVRLAPSANVDIAI